jgi:ElaB/YqjD/DUF883 family membrane-anchored ribosome-binding protein
MATPTPKDSADVGRLEHEIAQVRGDLGRTVQEIGTRLTPAHLMEQAKRSLKENTVETTKAVAQSATDVASGVATRTRDVALDARDQVQEHPYAVGGIGVGVGLGYWLVASALRRRRRLVPREWDRPFDRSTRRVQPGLGVRSSESRTSRLIPVGAAATAAWLLWTNRH